MCRRENDDTENKCPSWTGLWELLEMDLPRGSVPSHMTLGKPNQTSLRRPGAVLLGRIPMATSFPPLPSGPSGLDVLLVQTLRHGDGRHHEPPVRDLLCLTAVTPLENGDGVKAFEGATRKLVLDPSKIGVPQRHEERQKVWVGRNSTPS